MDRPRLIRGLRIAWSVWWGILCVLLIALWVRSYRLNEVVSFPVAGTKIHVQSLLGRVTFARASKTVSFRQEVTDSLRKVVLKRDGRFGFSSFRAPPGDPLNDLFNVRLPHLFLVAVFAILATLPWAARSKRQFSLRGLFIFVTIIAVAVGIALIIARSG